HNQFEVAAVRARVLIAQQQFEKALEIEPPSSSEGVLSGMRGEWFACRALAFAGCGENDEATRLAGDAATMSTSLEAVGLATAAHVIVATKTGGRRGDDVRSGVRRLIEWKYLDAFVLAVRACPAILKLWPR